MLLRLCLHRCVAEYGGFVEMTNQEFIDVFVPLQDGLYRVAYHILESCDDAYDAVQDLYAKLWARRDVLDDIANPKAYCITLLKNACLDRVRSAQHRDTVTLDAPAALGASEDPPDDEAAQKLRVVMHAIRALPPGQRQVLEMKVLRDMSYEQIQKETRMNYLSLRVMLSQARRKLKKLI